MVLFKWEKELGGGSTAYNNMSRKPLFTLLFFSNGKRVRRIWEMVHKYLYCNIAQRDSRRKESRSSFALYWCGRTNLTCITLIHSKSPMMPISYTELEVCLTCFINSAASLGSHKTGCIEPPSRGKRGGKGAIFVFSQDPTSWTMPQPILGATWCVIRR